MNPNDEIREAILRHLYDRQRTGLGIKSAEVGISDLKKAMKALGIDGREAVSNLNYLVDGGWILPRTKSYKVRTRGGVDISQEQTKFKISDKGVNHFEGSSEFQAPRRAADINITNVQGVVQIGDHNVVNSHYQDLFRSLDLLGNEVRKSAQLTDQEKLNYQAEIDTISSQLAKQSPNTSIISTAWAGLVGLATLNGVASFFQRVQQLIQPLTG